MPYIPPEVVEQAQQLDLLTYLQSYEPQEIVRISGNNYTTCTHDSLEIFNGRRMWWPQRIVGYNAFDYTASQGNGLRVLELDSLQIISHELATYPT